MSALHDRLFLDTVEDIRRLRQTADQAMTKASSKREVSSLEKLSAIKSRNEDIARVGKVLTMLGEYGFENVAMSKASEGSNPSGWSTDGGTGNPDPFVTHSDSNGSPAANPSSSSAVTEAMTGPGDGSNSPSDNKPVITTTTNTGGPRPDNVVDAANPSTTETMAASPDAVTGAIGAGTKDLADGSANQNLDNIAKASTALRNIAGGKYVDPEKASQYLRGLGLSTSMDALNVFAKTASVQGRNLGEYLAGMDLSSLEKKGLMISIAREKKSQAGLDGEISAAKDAAEAYVKATKTLPSAAELAQAANVDPMAANIGVYEVAELIAATGGQVGDATAGVEAPLPGDLGAPPPAAGDVGGPPMTPAAPTPPPVDPSMMGAPMGAPPMGAPPMGAPMGAPPAPPAPGMTAMASAGKSKLSEDKMALLRSVVNRVVKRSADASLERLDREESTAGSGVSSNSDPDMVHDPAPSADGSPLQLTPQDRNAVDNVLGSNAGVLAAGQSDLEGFRNESAESLVDTAVSNPGTKGDIDSTEDVKSTFEGDTVPSSAQTGGETYTSSKSSEMHSKDEEEEDEGSSEEEEMDEKDKSMKESRVRSILRDMFPELNKVSYSTMYADGAGTSEVSPYGGTGESGTSTGDGSSMGLKKAIDYVKSEVKTNGRIPSSQDVMDECNVREDEAQAAIARGVENK